MADPVSNSQKNPLIVIVTGPAGAGRTTAIHSLEDFGFEAIDNLPLLLLRRLLDGPIEQNLAIGIDPRTRDFQASRLLEEIDFVNASTHADAQLLYVDCDTEALLRRFSETRRRHPSARDETPNIGVEREFELLRPLKDRADVLIDTSELSPHQFREQLSTWFSVENPSELSVSVHSFAFKRGVPRGLDMIMDLRFLRNPHWDKKLRSLDGRDQVVADFVYADPLFAPFFEKLTEITTLLLPAYNREGKSYFSIGLGCTGGQHRSVCVAETFAKTLAQDNWQVSIRHRELERKGLATAQMLGKVKE